MKLKSNVGKNIASAFAAMSLALVSTVPGFAAAVTDAPNDFLPSFNGAHNGDLDVVNANVTLDGSNFVFTAALNGAVGETPNDAYVFGIDRGQGTPKFGNIGNPGVVFDATYVLNVLSGGTVTSQVKDLISGTALMVDTASASGNTITGSVPVAFLPSEGLSPNNYRFNLWPESGAPNAGNTEISDFAPDNSVAGVSVAGASATPEPGTMSLFAMAAAGAVAMIRRRKLA